ncbi:MAG TPA: hypothetical protein VIT67_15155 [Povalibacter sp.]
MSTSALHFIGGEKGGVGKSLVARVLAQYLIDQQRPFKGFDTDKSHGALLRFYAAYASPVVIDRYEALDQLIEVATESPQSVVVDLAAQTHGFLVRWIEDSGLLGFADEVGVTLTYWHVMDAGRDSVDLLGKLLDLYGPRLKLVVVLNEVRGDQFDILKTSGELERAASLGAVVIRLPKLQDATMQKIDQFSSSFWAATQASDKAATGLGMLERQRVKVWLHKAYQQLESIPV